MGDSIYQNFENEYVGNESLSVKELLPELDEMELATELLEVSTDEELDLFLGNLLKKVSTLTKKFVKSDTGRALGKILKKAAKQSLPVIGKGIGGYFGGDTGAKWGKRIGESAGVLMGLELEGLSPEDQEFEVARRFVKFAANTISKTMSQPSSVPPNVKIKRAFVESARKYAPGLLPQINSPYSAEKKIGRWIRNGRKILIINC